MSLQSGKVRSEDGDRVLGRIQDLVLDLDRPEPEVTALVYRACWSRTLWRQPWSAVLSASSTGVVMRRDAPAPICYRASSLGLSEVMAREFLIYKRIVENYGGELERVKDLRFVKKDGKLVLVQMVAGMRGLLRRLGLDSAVSGLCKRFLDYDLKETYVAWDYIGPVGDRLGLRLEMPAQSHLALQQASNIRNAIEDTDDGGIAATAHSVKEETIASALEMLDAKDQGGAREVFQFEKSSDIIGQIPQEAAGGFSEDDSPEVVVDDILQAMDDEYEAKLKRVPEREENEIERLMTTRFMALAPDKTVLEALAHAKQNAKEIEVIDYIYVVGEESRLLGVTSLRELLSSEIFTPLERIMTTSVLTVHPTIPAAGIVDMFAKHGFRAIPLVDESNRIKGVIRFKAIAEILVSSLRNCS